MEYSQAFLDAIKILMPHEDAYARGHWGDPNFVVTENVPGDSGGLTKYGIDQASNPGVYIPGLTEESATAIYYAKYWLLHNLDALPEKLAICCFDVWVNGGHAVLWLQQAINDAGYTPPLNVDGGMGPITLAAANACNVGAVVVDFLSQRDARFRALAANPSMQKFLAGWLQRDADLKQYLLS